MRADVLEEFAATIFDPVDLGKGRGL